MILCNNLIKYYVSVPQELTFPSFDPSLCHLLYVCIEVYAKVITDDRLRPRGQLFRLKGPTHTYKRAKIIFFLYR